MSDIEKTPDTAPKELLDSIRTIADENTAEAIHEAIADAPDQEEAPPSIDVSADEAPAENAPAAEPVEEAAEETPEENAVCENKPARSRKPLWITLAAVGGVIVLLLCSLLWLVYGKKSVYPGVSVMGNSFSGLNAAEIRVRLNELNDVAFKDKSVTVSFRGETLSVSTEELGMHYDTTEVTDKLLAYGREGSFFARIKAIFSAWSNGHNVDLSSAYAAELLAARIGGLADRVFIPVRQPSHTVAAGNVTVLAGTPGYSLDVDAALAEIGRRINDGDFSPLDLQPVVTEPAAPNAETIYTAVYVAPVNARVSATSPTAYTVIAHKDGRDFDKAAAEKALAGLSYGEHTSIPLRVLEAEVKYEDLAGREFFTDILGTTSSTFNVREKNRTVNVTLAAKHCNGIVLMPGDEFSFNGAVGPRTAARGFKSAAIFAGGEVVDGLGGGICQVSSMIYMSALKAELSIVNRRPHRFTVDYTPIGQDATVVYGSIDFKFKNSNSAPVYLSATISGGTLTVTLYGTSAYTGEGERTVSLETKINTTTAYTTKYTPDNSLAPGASKVTQKGKNGYTCEVWRVIRINGAEISREKVNNSTYSPCTKQVKQGPAVTAAPSPAPTATPLPKPTSAPTVTVAPATPTAVPTPTPEPAPSPTTETTPTVEPTPAALATPAA